MPTVSTNIKIDADTKKQAQELFRSFGMNLSTAVNLFLKQAIREQAIPFRIAMYGGDTLAAMHEADAICAGAVPAKTYHSAAELIGEAEEEVHAENQTNLAV